MALRAPCASEDLQFPDPQAHVLCDTQAQTGSLTPSLCEAAASRYALRQTWAAGPHGAPFGAAALVGTGAPVPSDAQLLGRCRTDTTVTTTKLVFICVSAAVMQSPLLRSTCSACTGDNVKHAVLSCQHCVNENSVLKRTDASQPSLIPNPFLFALRFFAAAPLISFDSKMATPRPRQTATRPPPTPPFVHFLIEQNRIQQLAHEILQRRFDALLARVEALEQANAGGVPSEDGDDGDAPVAAPITGNSE